MRSPWGIFVERINPFLGLWGHGTVSLVAVPGESAWECLALQVMLSEGDSDPNARSWLPACDGRFLLVHWAYPVQEALRVAQSAALLSRLQVRGPDGATIGVRLASFGTTPRTRPPMLWSTSLRKAGAMVPRHPLRSAQVLWAGGQHVFPWLGEAEGMALDAWLVHPPGEGQRPINGFAGWLKRFMPGVQMRPGTLDGVQFQVVAPIPVDVEYSGDSDRVQVHCASNGIELVSASAFYEPGYDMAKLRFRESGTRNGPLSSFDAALEWPGGAESAEIVVQAQNIEIERLTVPRWSHAGNLRAAVATYFDADHSILRSQLLGEIAPGKNPGQRIQDQFEGGVHRLLSLLGLPCVFYGDKGSSAPSRPDAVIITHTATTATVVLVECTTGREGEKIGEKIIRLAERVNQLGEHLHVEDHSLAVDIRGAVFSRNVPLEADWQTASQRGIRLVGPCEIGSLINRLEGARTPGDEVLTLLIQSSVPLFSGNDSFSGQG